MASTIDWDTVSKAMQSLFYVCAIVLGVLTYRRARTTILNTVNTEYHKKVIEKLAELSDTLHAEFDQSSEQSWTKSDDVGDAVEIINANFEKYKEQILESREWGHGIPVSKDWKRLHALAERYKSDPFLPDPVRRRTLALLEGRLSAIFHAHLTILRKYTEELAQGKHQATLKTNKHWLHNQVNDSLNTAGYGIDAVESEVHAIRLEIQAYFKKFEP